MDRFERLGAMADLEAAIAAAQEALALTPDDHPKKRHRMNSLAGKLWARFGRLGAMDTSKPPSQLYERLSR
jgi:hypothetical protein